MVTITVNGVSEVFGAELPRVEVFGLGGQDTITLIGLTRQTLVDAAPGDDVIDASAVAAAHLTLRGGTGADQITGGQGADLLEGGPGMDTLLGLGGADQLAGGLDADVLDAGEGNDTFAWQAGHGDDVFEGGPGDDRLTVTGSGAAEIFDLRAAAAPHGHWERHRRRLRAQCGQRPSARHAGQPTGLWHRRCGH